ncbi:MAG: Rrf2 family transcriptional regulator [Candidatus Eisenbacteria bacterium]|nr:Rrf2 family transcriptional regulator [Candidatus Eisenbacteria bacterium]
MLTRTTETGVQVLLYLAMRRRREPASPRAMAGALGLSASYLSKVTGQLVRAGVLVAHKGSKGGVTMARPAAEIRLLEIVEALQGSVTGDYCRPRSPGCRTCGFHRAMREVHHATLEALSRWTLAEMASTPGRSGTASPEPGCLTAPVTRAVRLENRKGERP